MKQLRKLTAILLVLILAIGCAGCEKRKLTEKEYEELANKQAEKNKKKVLLRITVGGEVKEITAYDLVYFLAYNEKEGLEDKSSKDANFRANYGENYEYWELTDSTGSKMKDAYKNKAFSTIAYTYIMYYEALNQGMQLEELRKVKLDNATKNFLNGFTAEQRARVGMTEACIRENYERVFLAEQFATQMTTDYKVDEEAVKASIEKEDYRVYETDYLYVAKYDYDENFQRVDFSAEESEARKNAIDDAFKRLKDGEDMASVLASYESIMHYSPRDVYRTDTGIEKEYVDAAISLDVGGVTFIETNGGYYVITLLDKSDFVGYDEALEAALKKAESAGITELYMSYESKYSIEKTSDWDAVELGKYTVSK